MCPKGFIFICLRVTVPLLACEVGGLVSDPSTVVVIFGMAVCICCLVSLINGTFLKRHMYKISQCEGAAQNWCKLTEINVDSVASTSALLIAPRMWHCGCVE